MPGAIEADVRVRHGQAGRVLDGNVRTQNVCGPGIRKHAAILQGCPERNPRQEKAGNRPMVNRTPHKANSDKNTKTLLALYFREPFYRLLRTRSIGLASLFIFLEAE